MTYEQQRQHFEEMISAVTDEAFQMLMRNSLEPIHLWFIASGEGKWGQLLVATQCPEGATAAADRSIPAHLTREQLRGWIRRRCEALPLFPV